jgi:hypothetical protein
VSPDNGQPTAEETLMRRAQQQTIAFPAYDSTVSTGALKTGLSILSADIQISKDGGAFAAATNPGTELGATGIYTLTLTATETACSWICVLVTKSGMRPQVVSGSMDSQPSAAVVADAGNTATTFVTNLTESANDHWQGAGVVFTSGALRGQVREIASFNGTTKAITLEVALTAPPAAGDAFVLING